MVIHLDSCANVAEFLNNPDKCVSISWADEISGEFPVELKIDYQNERGLLAKIAALLSTENINIDKIRTEEIDARFGSMYLLISVKDRIHLANIVKKIRKINVVSKITRVKH